MVGRKRIPTQPGDRFGRLTVIRDLGAISTTDNRSHSLCECDCGIQKKFVNAQLRRGLREGRIQSCGCHAQEIWKEQGKVRGKASVKPLKKGQRFGRLVVIEQMPHSVSNYHCQCDCGNTYSVQRASLVGGVVVSCGCYRRDTAKNLHTFRNKAHS